MGEICYLWLSVCLRAAVKDNSRYGSLKFNIDQDTVLHGFGGYFYCLLYADIAFSMSLSLLLHLSSLFARFCAAIGSRLYAQDQGPVCPQQINLPLIIRQIMINLLRCRFS